MLDKDNDTQAGAEEAPKTLGEMLRAGRAAQDLSLDEVAADLRIEARALRALEEHRFEELGAPVFAKGYLKQYAHRLNLSYNDLLSEYYRLADPRDVTIEPSRVIKLHDERQITIWIVAVLVLLLLGVALFVWWLSQPEVSFATRTAPAADIAADIASELSLDPAPAAAPATQRTNTNAGRPEAERVAIPAPTPETPRAIPEPTPAATTAPAVAGDNADAAVAGPLLQVVMNFEQDSWAEVIDARGERLFYGLGRAGMRSEFAGAPPVDVSLGNAAGVRLVVDSRPFAVPNAGRQGNVARFTLDARD